MRHRKFEVIVAVTGIVALFTLTWPIVRPQSHSDGAGNIKVAQENILQSIRKPKVPITDTTTVSDVPTAEINRSMRARRDQAWAIVEEAWQPVTIAGSKIPEWMTWYEEQDVAELYRALLEKNGRRQITPSDVNEVIRQHPTKDLQTSLTSARLGKTLRQFTFPNIPPLGPNRKPATGVIYYNTAYVRHLLENAEQIARCNPASFPRLSFPGSSVLGSSTIESVGVDRLPLQLPDPSNQWALCMKREMPADAIMIKVNWVPVIKYDSNGAAYVAEHDIDTSAKMASTLSSLPSGRWREIPWDENSRANGGIKAAGFRVTDENGHEWELRGMHIVKKSVRTWMWTTVFEAGGEWNWGADKPPALARQWSPLSHYGMCTVSDFRENDPAPWSGYEGKGEHLQSLADTMKAVARVMQGAQWCSNPYIETNMAFGNCIGCHQGSTETFLPTTVFQGAAVPMNKTLDQLIPETILRTTQLELPFNTSDFSFSFAINRSAFQEALRQRDR